MSVAIMNTKHQDIVQDIYHGLYEKIVDISDISGIHTICSKETVEQISKRLDIISDASIHFLGNGNFHYLTLPLLKRYEHPFTLIVFDHHNDGGELGFEGFTSCGSWLNEVIRSLPMVEKIVIVGVGEENGKDMVEANKSAIEIISENQLDFLESMLNEEIIPTKDVYISIDRDILTPNEIKTNWSQGTIELEQLKKAIQVVSEDHRIIGADVCGDLDWDYTMTQQYEMEETRQQAHHVNRELFFLLEALIQREAPAKRNFLIN